MARLLQLLIHYREKKIYHVRRLNLVASSASIVVVFQLRASGAHPILAWGSRRSFLD